MNCNNPNVGIEGFDGTAEAGNEAAPADCGVYGAHIGQVVHNFQADGSAAGNHVGIAPGVQIAVGFVSPVFFQHIIQQLV